MKIEDLLSLPMNPAPSPGNGPGKDNFAECLQEAISSRQQQEGVQALGGPAPVTAPEMVDAVLSRLEIFQEGLARPDLNLKSLDSLVQALEKDSKNLDSLARSLSADNPLRQIVEETAALTWTESSKFKRGDYI